jgi:hypothetical protein
VWLGNSNSTIWKYNGASWSKFGEYKIDGFDFTGFDSMMGNAFNNIYVVGATQNNTTLNYKAIIAHYDGVAWKFENVPTTKTGLSAVEIDPKTGTLVIAGLTFENKIFTVHLYYWDGKELKELLSEIGGWSFVTKLGDEVCAWMNSKIYKYENKKLVLWKDNTGTSTLGNVICGRSRNDFFIGSGEGIKHYDGTDFATVFPTNWAVRRGIVFEKEAFFIGDEYTTGKNYIIHGKLN